MYVKWRRGCHIQFWHNKITLQACVFYQIKTLQNNITLFKQADLKDSKHKLIENTDYSSGVPLIKENQISNTTLSFRYDICPII